MTRVLRRALVWCAMASILAVTDTAYAVMLITCGIGNDTGFYFYGKPTGPIDQDRFIAKDLRDYVPAWGGLITFDLDDGGFLDDAELTITWAVTHEQNPKKWESSFYVDATDYATGAHILPVQYKVLPHGSEFDSYWARLSFAVDGDDNIAMFKFELDGRHGVTPIPEACSLAIWSLLGGFGVMLAWWRRRAH